VSRKGWRKEVFPDPGMRGGKRKERERERETHLLLSQRELRAWGIARGLPEFVGQVEVVNGRPVVSRDHVSARETRWEWEDA